MAHEVATMDTEHTESRAASVIPLCSTLRLALHDVTITVARLAGQETDIIMDIPAEVLERAKEIAEFHQERVRLLGERKKLTAELDHRIAAVESSLASLLSTRTPASEDEKSGPRPGSFKERFIKFIEANPGCDYAAMAKAIYGNEDEGSRNKARSTVHVLHKDKIVETVGLGRWRIAQRG